MIGKVHCHRSGKALAGSPEKIHLHIHTNHPDQLFHRISEIGSISKIKVDDMLMQYRVSHERKYPIVNAHLQFLERHRRLNFTK